MNVCVRSADIQSLSEMLTVLATRRPIHQTNFGIVHCGFSNTCGGGETNTVPAIETSPQDVIPISLMKYYAPELSVIVAHIANLSFNLGQFLSSMNDGIAEKDWP